MSIDPDIRGLMESTGFGEEDIDEGWRLLRAACSARVLRPEPPGAPSARDDAERAIDELVKSMMPRARAALHRLHPDEEAFLFDALPASGRRTNVLRAAAFVERCEALAGSPKRRASRKEDHAALAALEKRGVTADVLARAKANAQLVMTTIAPPRAARRSVDSAALGRLHSWLKDWSDCARTVIARRDWLIRLGIGRRRPMKRGA